MKKALSLLLSAALALSLLAGCGPSSSGSDVSGSGSDSSQKPQHRREQIHIGKCRFDYE